MNSAKVSTSVRFRDYLIESLKEPEAAAGYIEAILEEEEPELTLLKSALADVLEAFKQTKLSSEQAELHQQQLETILSPAGSQTIYSLASLLKELGLKLTVTVDDSAAEA